MVMGASRGLTRRVERKVAWLGGGALLLQVTETAWLLRWLGQGSLRGSGGISQTDDEDEGSRGART